MSPIGGMWALSALRVARQNLTIASKMLRAKFITTPRIIHHGPQQGVVHSSRYPAHPVAWAHPSKPRWHSTAAIRRRFLTIQARTGPLTKPSSDRSTLPDWTRIRAFAQSSGRALFASTLRPNLTGGTLPRTAGGYAAPGCGRMGGARFFSHTPTAPAEIMQNVSQAVRCFWLSGQRARYDGEGHDGSRRYKAVSATHEQACSEMGRWSVGAPGSFVDFKVSPTITALSPLGVAFPVATAEGLGLASKPVAGAATLNADGFLTTLSEDFARALKDLEAVMTDLQKLSSLGDLPITMEKNHILRIWFPGLDVQTVESLCDDVGVRRGMVGQDAEYDASGCVEMALRYPFAPSGSVGTMSSASGPMMSNHSDGSDMSALEKAFLEHDKDPWYSEDFEGLEDVHRFLEECNRARGRYAGDRGDGQGIQRGHADVTGWVHRAWETVQNGDCLHTCRAE